MKKYLVIGNPINHSLSPKLHNYWIKIHNIDAYYEKKLLNEVDLAKFIEDIKSNIIDGANITVPFKQKIINFIDDLTPVAKKTNSVNTIFIKNEKIIGDNTDVDGFELALKHINFSPKEKKILLLGAGGVSPSIILSLENMGAKDISLSNRTKEKATSLKMLFPNLNIINWGEVIDFDMIINDTSLGLKRNDKIEIDFKKNYDKKLFYDIIYNPAKTDFLSTGEKKGSQIENGILMFAYQAQLAFKKWHGILPEVDKKVIELLLND